MRSKILLIEDDQALVKLYQTALELADFEVVVAFDGKVGLARALHEQYQLIILDLMLPQMNGLDVLKVLGDKGIINQTPVIVLTNLDKEELEEAKRLGARECFVKVSLTPDELVEKVEQFVK